jgi:chromosome segregation ATPase
MALIVFLVFALGLWGCAQGNSKPLASTEERIKALESRYDNLEKKHKAVLADRERAETRVAALEKERLDLLKLVEHGKAVSRERDNLKVERDAVQTQFEELRKGIRSLLGRVESALPPAPANSQSGAVPAVRPKL